MAAQGTISGTQMGAWGVKQAKPRGKIGVQAWRKRKLIKLPRAQFATTQSFENQKRVQHLESWKYKKAPLIWKKDWQNFVCTLITPIKGVTSVSTHSKFLDLMRFDQQAQNIEAAVPVLHRALFVFW